MNPMVQATIRMGMIRVFERAVKQAASHPDKGDLVPLPKRRDRDYQNVVRLTKLRLLAIVGQYYFVTTEGIEYFYRLEAHQAAKTDPTPDFLF